MKVGQEAEISTENRSLLDPLLLTSKRSLRKEVIRMTSQLHF